MQQYVIFNVLKEYCIPKEEEDGQKYAHASNLPYIFHINYSFSKYYLEINSRPILIIISSRKAERYIVYSSNFEITF